jgi:hypothetical protein
MTINLELIEEFLHDRLRYKSYIKPIAYKIYADGKLLWIGLDKFGESIKTEVYLEWFKQRRSKKIKTIIEN